MRQQLCKVNDIAPGEMKRFEVNNRKIVVVRKDDNFYAMMEICSHQGAYLGLGALTGTSLPSSSGEYCYGKKGEIIRCPWHNHEFDVTTGESLHDPKKDRLKTYKVEVEGDDVFIEI